MKYNAEFPNSSMIQSCSYDNETKELTVTFKNGKDYVYVDVDKSIFDAMEATTSVGRYFNSVKQSLVQKI
jgi:hypothetical protein